MSRFMTPYSYIDNGGFETHETNDGTVITDSTGYIPASRYISQMLESGVLLERQRANNSEYEYEGNVDEDDIAVDPTRLKSFDVIDAQRTTEYLEQLERKARDEEAKAPGLPDSEVQTSLHPKNEQLAEGSPNPKG